METRLLELIDKIQGAVEAHGAEALRLALLVIRIQAAFELVGAVTLLVAVLIGARFLRRWWEKDLDFDADGFRMIITILSGVVGLIALIVAIVMVTNARLWLALYDPRLALVYDVINRLGK